MAPKYILTYFPLAGRAEAVRLMFHEAGVEFEDKRIPFDEWPKNKTDEKRFPLGVMPTLQVDDVLICQSGAINRYVAREYGFYGNNTMEQAIIDQVGETLVDIKTKVIPIIFGGLSDDEKKTKFAEFFSSAATKKAYGFINNLLKSNNGGNGFIVGDKVSLADITIYTTGLLLEPVNPNYLDDYPELKALIVRVTQVENIKKYLDSKK